DSGGNDIRLRPDISQSSLRKPWAPPLRFHTPIRICDANRPLTQGAATMKSNAGADGRLP
ncbi:hypothetical protein, partial [Marilutibacter maris]|uniref:hypothetical protein n=1 Tax=Marilutibacter maris TaxID=1605891 RepID=UPI001B87F962